MELGGVAPFWSFLLSSFPHKDLVSVSALMETTDVTRLFICADEWPGTFSAPEIPTRWVTPSVDITCSMKSFLVRFHFACVSVLVNTGTYISGLLT